jgi:hypothetical protein
MIPEKINRASGAAVGFVIAAILFAVLALVVKFSVNVPAVDADRATTISQALFEMRSNEVASLDNAGWADQPRGIVRLPVETAMQQAAQAWQNPAAARADLTARAERAAAPAPKVAPKPNPAE